MSTIKDLDHALRTVRAVYTGLNDHDRALLDKSIGHYAGLRNPTASTLYSSLFLAIRESESRSDVDAAIHAAAILENEKRG